MFQNRQSVFLFVCSIVFVQALYYIITLQIKKNDSNFINTSIQSISYLIYNQSSDIQTSLKEQNTTRTNLIQVSLT